MGQYRAAKLRKTVGANVLVESVAEKHRKKSRGEKQLRSSLTERGRQGCPRRLQPSLLGPVRSL